MTTDGTSHHFADLATTERMNSRSIGISFQFRATSNKGAIFPIHNSRNKAGEEWGINTFNTHHVPLIFIGLSFTIDEGMRIAKQINYSFLILKISPALIFFVINLKMLEFFPYDLIFSLLFSLNLGDISLWSSVHTIIGVLIC